MFCLTRRTRVVSDTINWVVGDALHCHHSIIYLTGPLNRHHSSHFCGSAVLYSLDDGQLILSCLTWIWFLHMSKRVLTFLAITCCYVHVILWTAQCTKEAALPFVVWFFRTERRNIQLLNCVAMVLFYLSRLCPKTFGWKINVFPISTIYDPVVQLF